MSWNARRFAIAAHNSRHARGQQALWLTAEAIDRIGSAHKHQTLDFSDVPPFPEAGIVVGFGYPYETESGGEVRMLSLTNTTTAQFSLSGGQTHTALCSPSPTITEAVDSEAWGAVVGLHSGASYYAMDTRAEVLDVHVELVAEWAGMGAVSLGDDMSAVSRRIGMVDTHLPASLTPTERAVLRYFAHAAWTSLHEPVEREVSATTLSQSPIRTGKGRRARDVSVSVIDVRRSSTTRSTPSGRVIERDHRWERIGHWRMQPFGKGRTERRRIWIDPVVCGPVDKPLLVRPKVSVLR